MFGEFDDEYIGCYYSLVISVIDDVILIGIVDVINYLILGGEVVWGDVLSEVWLLVNNVGIFVVYLVGNDGLGVLISDKFVFWIMLVVVIDYGRIIDYSKILFSFLGGGLLFLIING